MRILHGIFFNTANGKLIERLDSRAFKKSYKNRVLPKIHIWLCFTLQSQTAYAHIIVEAKSIQSSFSPQINPLLTLTRILLEN